MQCTCRIARRADGQWSIHYDGRDLGPVELTAATREQALDKMRRELKYRLELCPCSGEQVGDVEIELLEA
jgi:hypothetical protein